MATGYNAAFLTVDALTRAAEMEGGLTRANLMNAFWSIDIEAPLPLGGVAKVDGITDAYIAEYGVMAEFDPADPSYKTAEGVEIDVEGRGRRLRRLTPRSTPFCPSESAHSGRFRRTVHGRT